MSDLALPPHLRGRLHNDWVWPFTKISRGWNAIGPRAPMNADDYAQWPPRLVAGRGVARWESAGGNSIIHIHGLEKVEITGDKVYGRQWLATEMNPGHPNFMKSQDVMLPHWAPARVWDEPDPARPGKFIQKIDVDQYSPSALQKFSSRGWMKLSPSYHSEWRVFKKRELPNWPETGDDTVAFLRRGNRPDHVDLYYNTDRGFPIGYAGLHWE